ncbi:ComEC/Rec2 family competence protein [Shigella sonnei]
MDPVAILSQCLWLSAAAVAALIRYQWFSCPEWRLPPVLRAVVSLIHLQLGITLLLMPVQIVIFHGISLTFVLLQIFLQFPGDVLTVPLILAAMVVH